jgi:uncharacterized membrane protein YgcG
VERLAPPRLHDRATDAVPRAKRPWWLVALPFAAIVPAGALIVPAVDRNGAIAGAIAAAVANPASLFAARSPGERAPGALTQTKKVRHAPKGLVPKERVLSQERIRPAAELPEGTPSLPVVPLELASLPDGGVPFVTPFVDGPDGGGIVPGGGGGIGGGGGGGGGVIIPGGGDNGGGGGGGEEPVPPVPPAVPEPATWAMTILGFFIVGTAARRRRRNLATAVQPLA